MPATTSRRRGPLNNKTCFVVRDHNGQQLAYVYFEDEPGRRSAAKLLTRDEARRIAANYCKVMLYLPSMQTSLREAEFKGSTPQTVSRIS